MNIVVQPATARRQYIVFATALGESYLNYEIDEMQNQV
jgi:hypothetical protein